MAEQVPHSSLTSVTSVVDYKVVQDWFDSTMQLLQSKYSAERLRMGNDISVTALAVY